MNEGTSFDIAAKQEGTLWRYRAKAVRVVDGDTIIMTIDLGFHVAWTEPVRLAGINAPELHGPEATRARHAKEFVEAWLVADPTLYIQTQLVREREKYGRVLATVYREGDPVSLNDALLTSNLAVRM